MSLQDVGNNISQLVLLAMFFFFLPSRRFSTLSYIYTSTLSYLLNVSVHFVFNIACYCQFFSPSFLVMRPRIFKNFFLIFASILLKLPSYYHAKSMVSFCRIASQAICLSVRRLINFHCYIRRQLLQ